MQTALTLLLTTVPGWFAILMLAACALDKLPPRYLAWMNKLIKKI